MFWNQSFSLWSLGEKILIGFRAPLAVFFAALFFALLSTPLVRRIAIKYGAVDCPKIDDRRVHKKATPRWGGIGIYIGILCSILIWYPVLHPQALLPSYLIAMLICGFLIVAMGAWDDVKPMKAKTQALFLIFIGFLVQFLSGIDYPLQIKNMESVLFTFGGIPDGKLTLADFAWPITAIYIFVVAKTMDTIDGLDGLAAGIAAIGSIALLFLGVWLEQPKVALVAAAVAGSCIGFLRYNFNPASIFMGTGGAQLLGFMLACTSMIGVMKNAVELGLVVPLLIFGIPLFDACFVIIRRLKAGQPISQADKRHVHHTLMNFGLNQRQTVTVLYLTALGLCSALLMIFVVWSRG